MQEVPFWENVVRFLRFGVTATTGLVAGLLSPFSVFLRTPTLMAVGSALLLAFLVFIYLTLTNMQAGDPVALQSFAAPASSQALDEAARAEPSMQRMLTDIYGP